MNVLDGATIAAPHALDCDVAIVGTGPAGAAAARTLALAGLRVVLLEEGPWVQPRDYPVDGFSSMALLYRDMGANVALGNAPMPVLQGRAVGGTSVVNGAISWRLPEDVRAGWVAADPGLEQTLDAGTLSALFDEIEDDLGIAPTQASVAGPKNLLMAQGADALGLEHRPIARNTRGCEGLGRCLQGCPHGRKQSMDLTLLPVACHHGAQILSRVTVAAVQTEHGRAVGVIGQAAGGGRVTVRARLAVVLAASAIQTPMLLHKSGIRHGPVGQNLQAHPGVAVVGQFAETVRMWNGATQGHEVIGLRKEGIKFEALGYDPAIIASRMDGMGRAFARNLDQLAHEVHWGVAVRAHGRGRVRVGWRGRPVIQYNLTPRDVDCIRRGVRVLGEMLFAAGALRVLPGVHGWAPVVTDRREIVRFQTEGPRQPDAYHGAITHLFGTCKMATDPTHAVVRPDFRHHTVAGLYVADSSVFPTATGVNPQTSILALATLCARSILRQ